MCRHHFKLSSSCLLYQKAVRYINKQSGNNSLLNSVHYYVSVKTVLMGKKTFLRRKNLFCRSIIFIINLTEMRPCYTDQHKTEEKSKK